MNNMNEIIKEPYYTRVIFRDGEGNVLVVVHKDRKVALPGGKIEKADVDPCGAAMREVREETGLQIMNMRLVHDAVYQFDSGEHRGVFFEALSWTGELQNKEPEKLIFAGWVSEDFLLATQHVRLTDALRACPR